MKAIDFYTETCEQVVHDFTGWQMAGDVAELGLFRM